MDDVYSDLENFTEESTNAELREENKNLKTKLDEYAAALDKLQKNILQEFDMLSSEHKKLEMNYSSLLKTARSEIERKTQIITKLNIEKDTMVLNAIQNRNTPFNRRKAPKDKPVNHKEESKIGNSPTQFSNESMKPNFPSHTPSERKEIFSPSANSATSYKNIQTIVNNARINDVKENIRLKDDGERSRARISSRRKSMPVFSMDCERVSTDEDEVASARTFKELTAKEQSGNKYLDKFPNDRPNLDDKMFSHQEYSKEYKNFEELTVKEKYASKHLDKIPNDKPCIEDKMLGHQGYSKESRNSKELTAKEQFASRYLDKYPNDRPHMDDKMLSHQEYSKESRSKYSKYDSDIYRNRENHESFQRHRRNISPDRRKRSHDRRKSSPDRNKRDARDHSEEFYKRQEYERRRRLVSPPKDKYYNDYKQRNRDSQRSNDRSHLQDFERYKSRSQDKHTMKHKILHDYEEQSSKRIKLDSNHKHEDERWRSERQVGPVPLDLNHLHNMSCQSPDQSHLEALPSHQAREIKFNASMKLDDPRLSSKKYTLKTHDGISELSTVESANINVKIIDTSNWDMIKTMKMPDALLKKPVTTDILRPVLLQKPMTSDKPDALSCDLPDAPLQRQQSTSISGAQYISQNTVSNDLPETLENRMVAQIPNDEIVNLLNQKSKTADEITPDAASQKPKSTNDVVMHDASTLKQKLTDECVPDASAVKPKSTNETMSDGSTQKLMSTDDLVKEIYMDIENPISNLSMESGALYDFDDDLHSSEDTINKNTNEITREDVVELPKSDNGSRKLGNYKIPKKNSDDTQNAKISKGMISSNKYNDKQTPVEKLTKTSFENIDDRNKRTDETCEIQERKIPQHYSSNYQYELQNYITAKNIIEGDLELSDETSDNADVQIKQTSVLDNKQNLDKKYVTLGSNKKHESQLPGQWKVDFAETISQNHEGQNLEEKSIETTVIATKKPKARKKSLKLKELHEHKDTGVPMNKAVKKKEEALKETIENKNTSLSMDQLINIKESITQELLENKDMLSKDKPIKKKESKSKVTSQNKETTVCIDKTIKKKESLPSENKNKVPSTDKPMKKKESKPKELPEKKEPLAVDKSTKKKENKKESQEHKDALSIEKPKNIERAKKKQTKPREPYENTECATAVHKQDKNKESKTKETKFSELFGDSSSLVSPEDLGLVPAIVAPPDNYVAIFEDAQDATDINTVRAAVASISMETSKDAICKNTQSNFNTSVESTIAPTITVEPAYPNRETVHIETMPAESSIIQTMYQNLQPEISPKDNIVKTVIISSGSQPKCTSEAIEAYPIVSNETADGDLHLMQCVKPTVLQDIALRALATSTPHKTFQQNVVQTELDEKISSCSNENRDASVDKTSVIANSITTNESLTNDADVPDVTIFVKRRRKVVRKK